jgi:hypothetical protein
MLSIPFGRRLAVFLPCKMNLDRAKLMVIHEGCGAMKLMCGAITGALLLIFSGTSNAAEYQYFNGQSPNWRSGLLQWLSRYKPAPENVSIGITPNFDIQAYLVPGQFSGVYSLQRLHHAAGNRPNGVIRSLMDGTTGKIIGFAVRRGPPGGGAPGAPAEAEPAPERGPSAGPSFDVYVLTWTRPQPGTN